MVFQGAMFHFHVSSRKALVPFSSLYPLDACFELANLCRTGCFWGAISSVGRFLQAHVMTVDLLYCICTRHPTDAQHSLYPNVVIQMHSHIVLRVAWPTCTRALTDGLGLTRPRLCWRMQGRLQDFSVRWVLGGYSACSKSFFRCISMSVFEYT